MAKVVGTFEIVRPSKQDPDVWPSFVCPLCDCIVARCSHDVGIPFYIMKHYREFHPGVTAPTKIMVQPGCVGIWVVPQ